MHEYLSRTQDKSAYLFSAGHRRHVPARFLGHGPRQTGSSFRHILADSVAPLQAPRASVLRLPPLPASHPQVHAQPRQQILQRCLIYITIYTCLFYIRSVQCRINRNITILPFFFFFWLCRRTAIAKKKIQTGARRTKPIIGTAYNIPKKPICVAL